jgi:hypothetical protein
VLHASHGVGFAAGLWRYLRSPDWPRNDADVELLPKRATLRAV